MSVSIQVPPTIPLKQIKSLRVLLLSDDCTELGEHIKYGLRCAQWEGNIRAGISNAWSEEAEEAALQGTETYSNLSPILFPRIGRTLEGDNVAAHKFYLLALYVSCSTFKAALDSEENPEAAEKFTRILMRTLNWLVMGTGFNNSEVTPTNPLAYPDAYCWANAMCIRSLTL